MKSEYELKQKKSRYSIISIMFILIISLLVFTGLGLWDLFGNRGVILVYSTLFVLLGIGFLISKQKDHKRRSQIITHIVSILTLSQIIYSFFLLGESIINIFQPNESILLNSIGFACAVGFIALAIYGTIHGKQNYKIHRVRVPIDNLPQNFDGYKIVQLSDIHAGSLYSKKALQKGIDLINAQDADLFVFTGDLVNNIAEEFDQRKEIFSQINSKDGNFSILGNHDYGEYTTRSSLEDKEENNKKIQQHHADMGWTLLLDSHHSIIKNDEHIALAGIQNRGDGFAQYGDLERALDGVHPDEITVLLSHDPTHRAQRVREYEAKMIHLTLSGHTHGMQMGIDLPKFKRSPIKRRYKYRIGLYEQAGRHLYVNRGFGVLGFNARIGILPEITVLELVRK